MAFYKYPKTGSFPDCVSNIRRIWSYGGRDENGEPIILDSPELPKVKFVKTIKLHGTNAGVSLDRKGRLMVQSRNRVLSMDHDNAGLYKFVMSRKEIFLDYLKPWLEKDSDAEAVVLYGEFAGANIQSKVALTEIPKHFFPFGLAFAYRKENPEDPENPFEMFFVGTTELLDNPENQIRNIHTFSCEEIEVDFANPEAAQKALLEEVDSIDKVCPVGKAFGVEGHGEGVVCVGFIHGKRHTFKVKGEAHSTSKVRTMKDVDLTAYKKAQELAESLVSDRRYEQGIEYLQEMELPLDKSSTGEFVKWVCKDVLKEESLVLEKAEFEWKQLSSLISKSAASWYLKKIFN